jgi:hypothetical protein
MTNKEQIQQDLAVAFDFVEQILDHPELTNEIPEGSSITFVNETSKKVEKKAARILVKKYVKVKRHFEVI